MVNNMNYGMTCGTMRMPEKYENCNCQMKDQLMGMPYAMAYVPWQQLECTYEPKQALMAGTIFPELDKPFYGRRGMR